MKTLFTAVLALLFLPSAFAKDPVLPAQWAMSILKTEFPHFSNPVWNETETTYQVKFNESDGIRCWLILNKKKGTTQALVRYYGENELPANVRDFLNSDFPKSKISGVTEVNVDNKRVYQINIEGAKDWNIVRIDDDLNMQIKDSFKKSN